MNKSIRINNYFFNNITDYDPERHDNDFTERMPNGTIIQISRGIRYYTFDISLEQLTPVKIGHLVYLENLCRPIDQSEGETLDFWDDTDGSALGLTFPIDVTIPENGFKFNRQESSEELYTADLKLEQVIESQ